MNLLLTHLYGYAKKYIKATGVYDDKPSKSKHNHGADAFQLLAANFQRFANNDLYLNETRRNNTFRFTRVNSAVYARGRGIV